ncbi:uncharacterized protein LOC143693420 [Agelaius phoeniceus]|uniref:uncharacterized protein LOC143693420 n=1 Tax=Agelaius phoeniceus TaxID=39638 RepID=UPI004054E39F
MDFWSPEKWESFQGLSRWIRAAAAANTRSLLLTSWATHQGRDDSTCFQWFPGVWCGFFQADNEMKENFSFFYSSSGRQKSAHQISAMDDFCLFFQQDMDEAAAEALHKWEGNKYVDVCSCSFTGCHRGIVKIPHYSRELVEVFVSVCVHSEQCRGPFTGVINCAYSHVR